MTASYETFYKIFTGKLNAIVAMTVRKAKVKGNMVKLLKYTSATNNFVEAIQQLPNDYEGDFAQKWSRMGRGQVYLTEVSKPANAPI